MSVKVKVNILAYLELFVRINDKKKRNNCKILQQAGVLAYDLYEFIILPCDPLVVICYLIWPY